MQLTASLVPALVNQLHAVSGWLDKAEAFAAGRGETPDGLLASTGNDGHIYRIQSNGDYQDIAHLKASQAISFADTASGIYVGTANAGKLSRLSHGQAPQSTYISPVFDAGVLTQWGRAEVETTTPGDVLEVNLEPADPKACPIAKCG